MKPSVKPPLTGNAGVYCTLAIDSLRQLKMK